MKLIRIVTKYSSKTADAILSTQINKGIIEPDQQNYTNHHKCGFHAYHGERLCTVNLRTDYSYLK